MLDIGMIWNHSDGLLALEIILTFIRDYEYSFIQTSEKCINQFFYKLECSACIEHFMLKS